jgi:predicted kinase
MPVLVLLNGGPASGKSTLAQLWAAERPMALALDIDVLRSMIADWQDHPIDAGLRARELALGMIRNHLSSGHDVIVPQFLMRSAFIDQLCEAAGAEGAQFIEVVLIESPLVAERRFEERARRAGHTAQQRVTHGPLGALSMSETFAQHGEFVADRLEAVVVESIDDDIPASLTRLRTAISSRISSEPLN